MFFLDADMSVWNSGTKVSESALVTIAGLAISRSRRAGHLLNLKSNQLQQSCCDKTDMNKPFLIKNIKTKRTKKDQKWPNHDAYNTQMNIHEHWSWWPIRRGVSISDDQQTPGWRWYDREESQRRTCIHAQTQDHMEQTAEHCHRRITTNRHMTYLEASNRIYPNQGSFTLPCIPFSSFSSPRVVDRGFCTYRRYRYKNPLTKDNPHLFPLHYSRIEPTPSQPHKYYFLICKNPELPNYKQNSISRYHHMYTKQSV